MGSSVTPCQQNSQWFGIPLRLNRHYRVHEPGPVKNIRTAQPSQCASRNLRARSPESLVLSTKASSSH